jgi:hypothetical protein
MSCLRRDQYRSGFDAVSRAQCQCLCGAVGARASARSAWIVCSSSNPRHLEHVLAEYSRYYNRARPHQGDSATDPRITSPPTRTRASTAEGYPGWPPPRLLSRCSVRAQKAWDGVFAHYGLHQQTKRACSCRAYPFCSPHGIFRSIPVYRRSHERTCHGISFELIRLPSVPPPACFG